MKRPGVLALALGAGLCLSLTLATMAGGRSLNHQQANLTPVGENYSAVTLRDGLTIGMYEREGRIERLYGPAFSHGSSPIASAQAFVDQHAGMLGTRAEDLLPVGPWADGHHLQGVMYRPETDDYKFTAVNYTQARQDIPVFRSRLILLTRNEAGYPLVLASVNLRDLGNWEPNLQASALDPAAGEAAVRAGEPAFANFTDAELVIWAGAGDVSEPPRLAYTFIADNGDPIDGSLPLRSRFVTDANTGEILFEESQIRFVDVSGNAAGNATQGIASGDCEVEAIEGLPYVEVSILGGSVTFADAFGNFLISNGGSGSVTVESQLQGQWFFVSNEAGANSILTQVVTPPGPANFVHNTLNTEYERAEVNGYIEANVIRDLALSVNPSYPTIWSQTNFPVYVNRNDGYCPGNAWYSGTSINFCLAAGGYPNTAWSSVIHHEYGHHLVDTGDPGAGGDYHEGMSDCVDILLTDDPGLGYGFFGPCGDPLRTADNTLMYPCSGEGHYCGQLISGCLWSTREQLVVTEPLEYLEILRTLTINSILLHGGGSITPSITIDFLTLDDDDPDIFNGTPHYFEIQNGFSAHNMPGPELNAINFNYPDGKPAMLNPGAATTFGVVVGPVSGTPVSGTGVLHYNLNGSGWVTDPMTETSPNEYEATFPASPCGDSFAWYVSADASGLGTVNDPSDAPLSTYNATVATGIAVNLDDNFETNLGWTTENLGATSGDWQRGVPVNDPGWDYDPASDSDGSGQCFLTQNMVGNTDIDDGAVRLTSPVMDLSVGGAVTISYDYFLRLTDTSGAVDMLLVEISSNGDAGPWIEIERHTTDGGLSWRSHEISQATLDANGVALTSNMKIRYTANDADPQSINESGLDAFLVTQFTCEPPVGCPEDLDGLNGVGQGDLNIVLNRWGDPACLPGGAAHPCPEDLDALNGVGQGDLNMVLNRWGDPECE